MFMRGSTLALAAGLVLIGLPYRNTMAQESSTPPLLGVDAAAELNVNRPRSMSINIPRMRFRVALAMSDRVAFEPAGSLGVFGYYPDTGRSVTSTGYEAEFGLVVRASPDGKGCMPTCAHSLESAVSAMAACTRASWKAAWASASSTRSTHASPFDMKRSTGGTEA